MTELGLVEKQRSKAQDEVTVLEYEKVEMTQEVLILRSRLSEIEYEAGEEVGNEGNEGEAEG